MKILNLNSFNEKQQVSKINISDLDINLYDEYKDLDDFMEFVIYDYEEGDGVTVDNDGWLGNAEFGLFLMYWRDVGHVTPVEYNESNHEFIFDADIEGLFIDEKQCPFLKPSKNSESYIKLREALTKIGVSVYPSYKTTNEFLNEDDDYLTFLVDDHTMFIDYFKNKFDLVLQKHACKISTELVEREDGLGEYHPCLVFKVQEQCVKKADNSNLFLVRKNSEKIIRKVMIKNLESIGDVFVKEFEKLMK